MNFKTRVLLVVVVLAGALVPFSCASLPKLPPSVFVAPPVATTPMEVCWLETGGTQGPAGFGSAGSSTAKVWDATASALLVRHPKGDVLIDSGNSPNAQEEVRELGSWKRFVFGQTAGRNVMRGDLKAMLDGLHATALKAIVISHAHPDHMGGVALLPGVPVWLSAEEVAFIDEDLKARGGVVMPAQARAIEGRRVGLTFESGPYLNYPRSHDVFGDGSVVIVPTFGHTPGSIATFVNLPGHRLVHVGDLINMEESIDRQVPKSKIMRALTDEDEAATSLQVARLVELHQQDPAVQILPAHDRAEWEKLFGPTAISAPPPCVGSR